jgi:hypothetical protein
LRRAGLFEAIGDAFERHFYDNEEDALDRARRRHTAKRGETVGMFDDGSGYIQPVQPEMLRDEVKK